MTIDLRKRAENPTAERGAKRRIAREIKAEANPALNLIEDGCLTVSGSGFRRRNL